MAQRIRSKKVVPKPLVFRLRWAIVIITSLLAIELFLRLGFGFGNPPLLQADPEIGYLFQPNQKIVRFGKRVEYNQYSQRSAPVSATKPPGCLRILMLGDSILNGGTLIDQSETISALLQIHLAASGQTIEVLNASAGSWGLGNQLGYLRKFGTFQSDLVILEIGAHDLTQPTSTSQRLDRDPNYPTKRPLLALQEILGRYIWPKIARYLRQPLPITEIPTSQTPQEQAQKNQQFLSEILAKIREVKALAIILFMPELQHLVPISREPPYKPELLRLISARSVPIVDIQEKWRNLLASEVSTYFRDGLHLNEAGNKAVARVLFEQICQQKLLSNCLALQKSKLLTNGRIMSLVKQQLNQPLSQGVSAPRSTSSA